MVIKLMVSEGSKYKVGAVTFTGAFLLTTNVSPTTTVPAAATGGHPRTDHQPHAAVSKPGQHLCLLRCFQQHDLHRKKFYESCGDIDVSSGGTLNVTKIPNTESNTIDPHHIRVDEAEKSYVERIDIRGNTKTKDKVLRRELAIAPGEVFDMTRVDLSKRRLEGLQYFEKVDTRTEPTDVPDRKNLVIGVEEKNTGNFSVGAVPLFCRCARRLRGQLASDLFNPPSFTGAVSVKMRLRIQLGHPAAGLYPFIH